jgi:hypothetical protein
LISQLLAQFTKQELSALIAEEPVFPAAGANCALRVAAKNDNMANRDFNRNVYNGL